ncbi:unnamed protein product [Leptidea sinapis]|uniref:Uncharacterized protein n=1 Tax=Leptidea sinapis TaxID=189913 RepID=A0A5E4QLP3_9NEOP|nr:unnamed protein product [Leptidea sinapis]
MIMCLFVPSDIIASSNKIDIKMYFLYLITMVGVVAVIPAITMPAQEIRSSTAGQDAPQSPPLEVALRVVNEDIEIKNVALKAEESSGVQKSEPDTGSVLLEKKNDTSVLFGEPPRESDLRGLSGFWSTITSLLPSMPFSIPLTSLPALPISVPLTNMNVI